MQFLECFLLFLLMLVEVFDTRQLVLIQFMQSLGLIVNPLLLLLIEKDAMLVETAIGLEITFSKKACGNFEIISVILHQGSLASEALRVIAAQVIIDFRLFTIIFSIFIIRISFDFIFCCSLIIYCNVCCFETGLRLSSSHLFRIYCVHTPHSCKVLLEQF